jgi:uncharacterized protein YbjT (DUF2867 family)
MFVVLGATGHTGAVVTEKLLDAGKKVRVLVRDAAKVEALQKRGAEVVTGSVESEADLTRALAGAEGVYALLPPDARAEDLPGRNRRVTGHLAAALEANAVPHVVLLSSVGADVPSGTGPIATVHHAEQVLGALKTTRLTAIRAAYFMENLLGLLHPMKTDGVLPAFSKAVDYPFPMIATRDIGETAAKLLAEGAPKATQIVELSAEKPASFADAARAFGAALGRDVKAISVPYEGIVPALTAAGLSTHMAGLYREMSEAFDAGKCVYSGKHRTLHGKITLEQFARQAVG